MIRKIHVALKTAKVRNAGTSSDPVLIIGLEDRDLLQLTLPTSEGLQEGKSAYYAIDISNQNLNLEYNYVRLGIRGADAWLPEYAFVWVEKEPQYENDPVLQPVALKVYASDELSTDENEGKLSIPLARAYYGGFYNQIQYVFILVKTDDTRYGGTQSPVWLTIQTKSATALEVPIVGKEGTPAGGVYLGNFGVNPFNFADIQRVEMRIEGDDAWMPEQVMVFVYQVQYADQKAMSPLVYITDWKKAGLPQMSADPKEGQAVVTLYQAYL